MTVSPTAKESPYHISLSDGTTTANFVAVLGNGKADPRAIRQFDYQRSGQQTQTGPAKYGDETPPYSTQAQDDWTGGRGAEDLDDDATKYYDASGVDTTSEFGVILGGLPHWTTGYRTYNVAMPGSVSWEELYGTQRYMARTFTPTGNYTAYQVGILFRKVGSPGALTVALYSNSSGSPNASLVSAAATGTTDSLSVTEFVSISATALTSGTAYWVVVYGAATDSASNHWEIATDEDASGKVSGAGASWANGAGLYYAVHANDGGFVFRMFEYKRALYGVKILDSGGGSPPYINGDRGAADSNAADKTYLNDAAKSWTVDEWDGCKALITAGPGCDENVPWRTIVGNTATALEVDTDWGTAHTTATEYVILGSDKWTSLQDLSYHCTDFAVADEFVYFAFGENQSKNVYRYRAYNSAGAWSTSFVEDLLPALRILSVRDPDEGFFLYGAQNENDDYGVCVWKAKVPEARPESPLGVINEGLHSVIGTLAQTDSPWDAWQVTNITNSTDDGFTKVAIAAGFTTGVAAVENLDTPIDITEGTALGVLIRSSVTTASSDLKLVFEDNSHLGKWYTATSVKEQALSGGAWTTHTDAFDTLTGTDASVTHTTAKAIYIISAVKFSQIDFDFGGTVNAVASVLTVKLFNGSEWTAVTASDGTIAAGATWAVDGVVSFTPIQDWTQVTLDSVTGYAAQLTVSVNLTATIDVVEVAVARKNNQYANIPALVANEWTWAVMPITPTEEPAPDESAIASIGLYVNTDNAAQNVWLRGGVKVLRELAEFEKLPSQARITSMVAYADENTEEEIPWVFTEDYVYKWPTTGGLTPIPLKEMAGLRSEENGKAVAVNDVYMYFNLGDNLERYFNRNLDDVGPNKGSGLPDNRRGTPYSLASYPGKLLCAINAGGGKFSSVLAFINNNWHEVYRSPTQQAARIRNIYVQSVPGGSSRLWVNMGRFVVWVPLSLNPWNDGDYEYIWEGHLISAYIYGGLQDVVKAYIRLKLFLENVSPDHRFLQADYQLDDDTAWTAISTTFDSSPVEEGELDTTDPPNVTGRRIRFRLRFYTDDKTETPRLKAMVLESIGGLAARYGYTWTTELADGAMALDLEGQGDSTFG